MFNEPSRKQGDLLHALGDPSTKSQRPFPKHANHKSGSQCYSHNQCDLRNGYICSQPATFQIPLSETWLHFQCNYVPHVSKAIGAALKLEACRSARCLLESNGSVMPNPPLDEHIPGDDQTTSGSEQYNPVSASVKSGLLFSPANKDNDIGNVHNMPLEATPSNIPPGRTRPGQTSNITTTSTPLTCPCNCTYFDLGCCFTNVVTTNVALYPHDDTELEPPFPGLACDPYTGLWLVPKGSSQGRRKGHTWPSPSSITTHLPTSTAGTQTTVSQDGGVFELSNSVPLRE